ncbi:hypothetical protein EV424DRAFT_1553823 [Suillus variegatus]|nr:hypothetical protein EV424DRAFT_1553823 [Suillus variegatus]
MTVTSGEIFTLVVVAAQSQTDAYIAAGRGVIHLFEIWQARSELTFPLCADAGPAGTYTSVNDGTTIITVASPNDQDGAVCLTVLSSRRNFIETICFSDDLQIRRFYRWDSAEISAV